MREKHDFTGMFDGVEKLEPLSDIGMKQLGKEKNLSDEEIVKALECCIEDNLCKDCYLRAESGCIRKRNIQTLDLINRLQADNKTLTDINNSLAESKKRLEMGQRVPELENTIADLRTKLNAKEVECTKQKAEIERLTEDYEERLFRAANVYQVALDEKAELQKEVDELNKELDKAYETERANIQAEIADTGTGCHWCKDVTVKDTAKEICDLILEHWEKKQFVECDWLRVAIAEKYGVEVE